MQIKTFCDQRLDEYCYYCGNIEETRDHIPSRILLNEPFPENLPVVPCYTKCNFGFSLDKEYLACMLECILHGTSNTEKLNRENIKLILNRKANLRQRIENSIVIYEGELNFKIEEDRFKNVLTKLEKGYYKFENSEMQIQNPSCIVFKPLFVMSDEEKRDFFAKRRINIILEIGSRASQYLHFDDMCLY